MEIAKFHTPFQFEVHNFESFESNISLRFVIKLVSLLTLDL